MTPSKSWTRFEWPLAGRDLVVTPPAGYGFRAAGPADVDAMLSVIAAAYASDPAWAGLTDDIERRVGGRTRARIGDPDAIFRLALHDGAIVGLNGAALTSSTGMNMITGICVDPRHQGKGLGRTLLGQTLIWLRDRGLASATVVTDTASVAARVYALFDAQQTPGVPNADPPKAE